MKYLITGGAGFIGSNLAKYLLDRNEEVIVFDNLSRKGTELNIRHLKKSYKNNLEFVQSDIRDISSLKKSMLYADVVFHLAGHVSITGSIENPREDFEVNVVGSLNILESARAMKKPPILIYSSTNKVYGNLLSLPMVEKDTRYEFIDPKDVNGVTEFSQLDFYTPYGCSKGSADQYFVDYSRVFNLPTIVFRQSCIYGPHQLGVEDQGWVAWFLIASELGLPINIYGNGKQVRDILFVDDLIGAYMKAIEKIKITRGQVYNIGGGKDLTYSIWREFQDKIKLFIKKDPGVNFFDWRPGDQKIFYSNNSKLLRDINWKPTTTSEVGLEKLYSWIRNNKDYLSNMFKS